MNAAESNHSSSPALTRQSIKRAVVSWRDKLRAEARQHSSERRQELLSKARGVSCKAQLTQELKAMVSQSRHLFQQQPSAIGDASVSGSQDSGAPFGQQSSTPCGGAAAASRGGTQDVPMAGHTAGAAAASPAPPWSAGGGHDKCDWDIDAEIETFTEEEAAAALEALQRRMISQVIKRKNAILHQKLEFCLLCRSSLSSLALNGAAGHYLVMTLSALSSRQVLADELAALEAAELAARMEDELEVGPSSQGGGSQGGGGSSSRRVLCPVCQRAALVSSACGGVIGCPAEGWQLDVRAEGLRLVDLSNRLAQLYEVSDRLM